MSIERQMTAILALTAGKVAGTCRVTSATKICMLGDAALRAAAITGGSGRSEIGKNVGISASTSTS